MDVLIAGGGTGGHLFPGIAVAEELRRRYPQGRILFVGTARGIETRVVAKAGFELALLPVSGWRGTGVAGMVKSGLRLPMALWAAWRLVRQFRPSVAVGVGGYAAGPAVLAAHAQGVPCVIMEQNAVAGVTNQILGKVVGRIVAAVPCADLPAAKTRVLGNPVRADLLAVRKEPYCPSSPPRLLILGGSQGASALNQVMVEVAARLGEAGLHDLPITHQTGRADVERVAAAYREAGLVHAHATAFIDDMAAAYRAADLLLCRAGATTLAEITVCGRPAVLVPFPFAVGDHQTANAQQLVAAQAAVCIPQSAFSATTWLKLLRQLLQAPERLQAMAAAAHALGKPNAVQAIVDTLEEEAGRV